MEQRLIDANALIEATKNFCDGYKVHWTDNKVLAWIDHAPTVDAVPVVRCKDCEHRGSVDCPMHYEEDCTYTDDDGYSEWYWIEHDHTCDDGFCDRGERRDSDG